jgi:serine/threonine protein kinase
MPASPGTRLGPYEIVALLGAGGMGEVYKATDTRLGRTVAIKLLRTAHTDRFEIEARAIAALNHPHICTLHDIGPNYLVMEYVEGSTLRGALPPDEAMRLALQIASALEAAHAKGIIHRDLKPDNIIVTQMGVKLLDFGLAKLELAAETDETTVNETLAGTTKLWLANCYFAQDSSGFPVLLPFFDVEGYCRAHYKTPVAAAEL